MNEPRRIVDFEDVQLQGCYDTHLGERGESLEDLGPIYALIATHDWFVMLEGSHSTRVHQTVDCLLSARMRPALRRWYRRSGVELDSAGVTLRDQLSRLAGERLEHGVETSSQPS